MPMDATYLRVLVDDLRSKGVVFKAGLRDDEISRIERAYEFRFPPDLRAILQFALPVSEGFPNWRAGWIGQPIIEWEYQTQIVLGHNLAPIPLQLAWPADGICFDIERNGYWKDDWGAKPGDLQSSLSVARARIAQFPKLIPIYSHRFIPSEPCVCGNPVFSVHQTDIIYYGFDLASYFGNEFKVTVPDWAATKPQEIQFWSKLAELTS